MEKLYRIVDPRCESRRKGALQGRSSGNETGKNLVELHVGFILDGVP